LSDYEKLLAPNSIAIIGASRKKGSLGKMFLDAVLQMKYKGKIYPVNPKTDEIEGLKCYADLECLPEKPDLAIILLPKDFVIPTVELLAKTNIKNVVVISAGFREVGGEGVEREKQLLKIIKENDMRMVGPNSMGLFNTRSELSFNGTFSPTPPLPGHVGFVSQSGALGVAVLELSANRGLGFSVFVSTGNKADISDLEILNYLTNDENTNVAILYQESIDNPAEFREVCTEFVKNKPLLVLKAGRTQSGLKAASSHTGALASDDIIADTFLKQCGAIRCETLNEMLDTALAFENHHIPAGNRVAVITNAGGPGILASDALEKYGLTLAELSPKTISSLTEILPAEAAKTNPVDMIASATHDTYKNACKILVDDPSVDVLFIIIVKPPVDTTPAKIIENLEEIINTSSQPFYFTVMAKGDEDAGLEKFRQLKVPVYSFPESAARALGNVLKYEPIKNSIKSYKSIQKTAISGRPSAQKRQASAEEILHLLSKYELPVCDHLITSSINEAHEFLHSAKNVAMKVANPEIIHKSDLGLVELNINSDQKINDIFPALLERIKNNLPPNLQPKVLIQKMIKGNVELVLGARRDEQFGPVLMFGLGGVLVELFKDVAFRVLPIDIDDAKDMIMEIKGYKLLKGFRNIKVVNTDNLAGLLVKTGNMLIDNPQIVEMDMNPLIWPENEEYPQIVDFRMTISD